MEISNQTLTPTSPEFQKFITDALGDTELYNYLFLDDKDRLISLGGEEGKLCVADSAKTCNIQKCKERISEIIGSNTLSSLNSKNAGLREMYTRNSCRNAVICSEESEIEKRLSELRSPLKKRF